MNYIHTTIKIQLDQRLWWMLCKNNWLYVTLGDRIIENIKHIIKNTKPLKTSLKKREYDKIYSKTPEAKAKRKQYDKKYQSTPQYKTKRKERREKPEFKAKRKQYRDKPENKAKQKQYYQKPEYKAKKKQYNRIYNQRLDVKAKFKQRRKKLDYQEKQKEYQRTRYNNNNLINTNLTLLQLKDKLL